MTSRERSEARRMPVSTRRRRRFSFCEPSGEKAILESNPIALFGCNVRKFSRMARSIGNAGVLGRADAVVGVGYIAGAWISGVGGRRGAGGTVLVAEMPVDAGADLGVSLLIGAAVGELGNEVVGHDAELEAMVDVVVDAAAEGVGEAGGGVGEGVSFGAEGAGGIEAGSGVGDAEEAFAKEAGAAAPGGGGDVTEARSEE